MKNTDLRFHERFPVRLSGRVGIADRKATIISLSAGGCAFRTTVHFSAGDLCLLRIPLSNPLKSGSHELLLEGEIVWTCEDYRIDTFYAYGVQFLSALDMTQLAAIVEEDAVFSARSGLPESLSYKPVA